MSETPDDPSQADPSVDVMLGVLVQQAEAHPSFSLSLTVNVAGAVVSGTLVGRAVWMKRLKASPKHEVMHDLVDLLTEVVDAVAAEQEEPQSEQFVHLADARYVMGGQPVPVVGLVPVFWRGRKRDITGWSFGSLTPGRAT